MHRLLLLCLLALILAGCATPLAPDPNATPLASKPATVTPAPVSEQPCASTSEAVTRHEGLGFCLLAPREATAQETVPGAMLVITQPFPPDQPEAQVTLLIERKPAKEGTLDTVIGEVLRQYPAELTAQVGQSELSLGGRPAIVLDGLPGQTMNRQTFVVVGDSLYTLLLMPYGPSVPEAQPIAEALWQSVVGSLTFAAQP